MREPSNTSEAEATGTIETVAVADLLLSTVRACDEERCCFEIHSAHGAPLRLQAPGKGAYNRWVEALRDAISDQLAGGRASIGEEAAGDAQIPPMLPHGKMLRSFTPPLSGKPLSGEMTSSQSEPCLSTESLPKQTLREAYASQIRAIECANALCCDCGGARPEWCVINLGIVVCLGCSGVHRSMGTHISKVRSLQLDKLDDATCQLLLDCGNATVNAVFEATFVRPQSGFVICDFIKQKWRDKAFVLVSKNADDLLFEAAKTDDTVGALRAFANGAKADSRDASGRTPLHACAESDRAAVAQLLLLNGDAQKLASNVDFSGNTPLGEAIASQHKTLEKLLGHVANGPSR
mmetsp:Transcript_19141/g.64650  ORF Transcript_19141/g.64650 Transcript_19141/m.64650 type:complete len:350 (-) Transcript_19141:73-1122(-)